MAAAASAADRSRRGRGRRQKRARADDCRRRYRGALLILEPLAEEGRGKDLVPALERSLARAVGPEQRLQRIDRVGQFVAEASRPRVVGPACNVVARRDWMRDLEIAVKPISNRDHGVVKSAILAVVVPEALGQQDGNAETAEDAGAPAVTTAGVLF